VLVAEVIGGGVAEVRVPARCRLVEGRSAAWAATARDILRAEGLVVLRGLLPSGLVRAARGACLRALDRGGALDPDWPLDDARVAQECMEGVREPPSLLRRLDVQQLPAVLRVLEHTALFSAAAQMLGVDEVVTTAYKWLRAVPPGKFTGPHMDRAYVGAGARLTAWVPLGDVSAEPGGSGALCWVPGSHVEPAVVERFRDHQSAGADGERSGWLAPDPGELRLPPSARGWRSADFAPGDVAFFGMDLLHTTVPNGSGSFRLSCDTRWQSADIPTHAGPNVGPWRGPQR